MTLVFPRGKNLITEAERLRKANNDLQQRLRYVAKEFKNLKEETRALSKEKRSLVSLNEPSDVSKAKTKIPNKKKKNRTKGKNPEQSDENKIHANLEEKTVVILGDSIV